MCILVSVPRTRVDESALEARSCVFVAHVLRGGYAGGKGETWIIVGYSIYIYSKCSWHMINMLLSSSVEHRGVPIPIHVLSYVPTGFRSNKSDMV